MSLPGSASSAPRPAPSRSSARPARSWPSPTARAYRLRWRPTGWPSAGCPKLAGSGESGWAGEAAGRRRHDTVPRDLPPDRAVRLAAEAQAAQSRYGYQCRNALAALLLEGRAAAASLTCNHRQAVGVDQAATISAETGDPAGSEYVLRRSSQWGAAEPRPSRRRWP